MERTSGWEEVVDIVDSDDNVLFQTSKSIAHQRGLLHRTVIGQARDHLGKFVLVEQALHRQEPRQLVCPVGGHVRAGESEKDALIREADEEIGLREFRSCRHLGRFIFDRRVRGVRENHYYSVFELGVDPLRIRLGSEAVGFSLFSDVSLRQALRRSPEVFGDSFRAVVERLYPQLLVYDDR